MTISRTLLGTIAALMLATAAASAQNFDFVVQSPRRAWLGFSYDPVRAARGQEGNGVVVRDVVSASPAERAGVEVGDTIIRINDINATTQFIASLGSALSPGDDVRMEVRRGGRSRTLTVTAAKPPADYVALGPQAGLLRLDGDSIRSLMRVFVDSVVAGIDTLRMPDIVVGRGNGFFRVTPDSLRTFAYGDSIFLRSGPGNVSVYRFFSDDSLRAEFDSLRTRLRSIEPLRFGFSDSVFAAPRGQVFTWSTGDSTAGAWAVGGAPLSFTLAGRSAIAGAELTRLDPGMEQYFGVRDGILVTRVPRDTPADQAGFRAGDVIIRVNDTAVATVDQLRREIQRSPRDRPARIEVMRNRQHVTLELGRE